MELMRRYRLNISEAEEKSNDQVMRLAGNIVYDVLKRRVIMDRFGGPSVINRADMEKEIYDNLLTAGLAYHVRVLINRQYTNCQIRYMRSKKAGDLTGVMDEHDLERYKEEGIVPPHGIRW
ncbi:hypothetical protein TCA2_4605 [Paenibacillus sp. TCA20]|uniref:hypothetical protein n=1 Tax=Paenibacillus sp. TCA20 TaxID=1499968 RepID=UPI0004D850FF|nr:hypothetical protein [Paenibacillus sp. TCA20]GAK42113.1 hypothetical protein TCA2_4605 [Paenibacillus sp. TCA20]